MEIIYIRVRNHPQIRIGPREGQTGNSICDNCMAGIVSTLCSGAEFDSRTEDIDEFSLSLEEAIVNIILCWASRA